jgi:hypothetical protein
VVVKVEFLNDMVMFDRVSLDWKTLAVNATRPAPEGRYYHGLTILLNKIYVFGGWAKSGKIET